MITFRDEKFIQFYFYTEICPPLSERRHEIECHFRQTPVPCNESYIGTIANVKCKDSFELKDYIYQPYNGIECGYDGTWSDKLYDCNPSKLYCY